MRFKALDSCLEIIQTGFTVRTREEMKPFETLVNKRISFDRIEQENFKEIFESKAVDIAQKYLFPEKEAEK